MEQDGNVLYVGFDVFSQWVCLLLLIAIFCMFMEAKASTLILWIAIGLHNIVCFYGGQNLYAYQVDSHWFT